MTAGKTAHGLRLEQRIAAGLPLVPLVLLGVRFLGSPRTLIKLTIMTQTQQTQRQVILDLLLSGDSITPLEALDLCGTIRLGAHIFILREECFPVVTERVRRINGKGQEKRYARYYLPEDYLWGYWLVRYMPTEELHWLDIIRIEGTYVPDYVIRSMFARAMQVLNGGHMHDTSLQYDAETHVITLSRTTFSGDKDEISAKRRFLSIMGNFVKQYNIKK